MLYLKKYNLNFELMEQTKNKLLNNEKEKKSFNKKLRKTITQSYKINEEDIIISSPIINSDSYKVTLIFKSPM